MNDTYAALMIAVIAGITLLMRIIPFLIFGNRKTLAYIEFLGKYLPYSIMGMLVVYCLKGISFVNTPFGIPGTGCCALCSSIAYLEKKYIAQYCQWNGLLYGFNTAFCLKLVLVYLHDV